ncbi:OLC1v1034917C1 [Oldenlandia corymbosa var. corymbosa]|uniref:OLC1v1034917C1 n=1 Tax=Oldenlandia corymbosa var. corymbosa TaxID=529605 RepID=A0AAV1CSG5_OLDCO|nr:OLC1v1034917C1 [Oldenlandia corymbosa var. corymbosa]
MVTSLKGDDEHRSDHFLMEIETDDENNEAVSGCEEDHDDDNDDDINSESDFTGAPPSRNNSSMASLDSHSSTWPQSYRKSIDVFTSVTPSSIGFLRGSSIMNSATKKPEFNGFESTLTRRLISSSPRFCEEDPLLLTLPEKPTVLTPVSNNKPSTHELPPPQQCSYGQTVLNAINALCGIGILSMPFALKEGGWLSLILLLVFAVITCYTGILLKRCLGSSPGLETYPDIGQAAFGVTGRVFIAVILYLELYSSCVEYLIMMSDNMSLLFPHAHLELFGFYLNSYQLCAIISTLVILPTVWLRNLSSLSYISVGGVIMLVIVVICLLWVGVINEVGFHPAGTALNLAKLPVTIGLYSFCYGSHSVFPNIYSSMKEPSRFPSILVISFSMAFILYTGVAMCGFLMFGEATKPQFTLNLPTKFAATGVAGWIMVLTPVTKYALTVTPIAFGLEDLLPSARFRTYGVSILIRTMLVISTLTVALAVPYFGSLMALIGSLLVMLVSLVLPCVCYIRLEKLKANQIVVCSVIILVGISCSIVGTISAIKSVAEQQT